MNRKQFGRGRLLRSPRPITKTASKCGHSNTAARHLITKFCESGLCRRPVVATWVISPGGPAIAVCARCARIEERRAQVDQIIHACFNARPLPNQGRGRAAAGSDPKRAVENQIHCAPVREAINHAVAAREAAKDKGGQR